MLSAKVQKISELTRIYLNFYSNIYTIMKEVICKLLEYSNLNVKQFSEKLGKKRAQAIYDILNGKTKRISETLASQIISAFPEIDRAWLLTGEGSMLKNIDSSQDSSPVFADNHSTAVNGYQNIVNSDPIIAKLIDELSAQRKLTESAQEALLTAMKQNTMLISKLK